LERNTLNQFILIVFMLSLSSCNFQEKMFYYPDTQKPSQDSLTPYHIKFWGAALDDYRGYMSTVPIQSPKGTVIVFHGNAGSAAGREFYVQALTPLGYRVILAEYPGYGGRKGKLGETVFVKDAKETVRLAFEQFGKPVFLLGESLGCAVVAAAVKDLSVQIDAIILITPWDTLLSVAKEKLPWLPVRLFLKDKYDNIENLKAFKGRIAIVGAEKDEVVPVHHAQALYQTLPPNKNMWIIKGAGHNDWFDRVGQAWWQTIMDYAGGCGN
jgi:pimeloyl-ACP methyl ester carboxylesterase